MALNQRGAMGLPIVLGILILGTASFGMLGLLRHWKALVEIQLRLDQCVAQRALTLKTTLGSIEKENTAIELARVVVMAATANPPARVVAQTALELLVVHQEISLKLWEMTRIKWLVERGCDGQSDFPRILPSIPVSRLPPDAIGSNALHWDTPPDEVEFKIHIAHPPRAAAAEIKHVEAQQKESLFPFGWRANWTPPVRIGTNFP